METIDIIVAPLENLHKEYKEKLKKFHKDVQIEVGKTLKAFMRHHPELKEFGWEGNADNYDDQSYYFDINNFFVTLDSAYAAKISHPEKISLDYYEQVFFDAEHGTCYDDDSDIDYLAGYPGDDIKTLAITLHDLKDILKNIFGEWSTVTVTPDSISIS